MGEKGKKNWEETAEQIKQERKLSYNIRNLNNHGESLPDQQIFKYENKKLKSGIQ